MATRNIAPRGTGKPNPIIPDGHVRYGPSLPFRGDAIPYDSNGERLIDPGMVVSTDTGNLHTGTYYVPCTTAETYGTDTNTALGILASWHNATEDSQPLVQVVTHGAALARYCYVVGSAYNSVTNAMWTSMTGIERR